MDVKGSKSFKYRRQRFYAYRRTRPFWSSMALFLSAFLIVIPVFSLSVAGISLGLSSVTGLASYVLAGVIAVCGAICMFDPRFSKYVGIPAIFASIGSLFLANLGGLVVGALSGIVGGSLALAWTDAEKQKKQKNSKKRDGEIPGTSPNEVPGSPTADFSLDRNNGSSSVSAHSTISANSSGAVAPSAENSGNTPLNTLPLPPVN